MTRLAALAGAELDVTTEVDGLQAAWRSAAVVVVGSDLAAAVAVTEPPRREGVIVVADDAESAEVWQLAVALGAAGVYQLPRDQHAVLDVVGATLDGPIEAAPIIAVIGGCGGAGASTLAAALALTSARARPTVLVDADRYGGGIDVLLGAEQCEGARWPELSGARGHLEAQAFANALPRVGSLAVLSQDRGHPQPEIDLETADAVAAAVRRAFAAVVVDLPRHGDPVASLFVARAEAVLLVVPATVRAAAAAAAVAASVVAQGGVPSLVVRDAGPQRLGVEEIASVLGHPVGAILRSESWVMTAAERAELPVRRGRGSLADACGSLLASYIGAREMTTGEREWAEAG